MKCISDNLFLAFLNNEIKSKYKKKITLHISRCETCQKKLNEWKKVINITEDFVQVDKDKINPPQIDTIINTTQIKPMFTQERNFLWSKFWWKPAVVTAAAAIALFAIIFISSVREISVSPDYIVFESEYDYTEVYIISEEYMLAFEENMLEEIYQDDELRDEILYESWDYIGDIIDLISDEDIKFFENEINKSKIT